MTTREGRIKTLTELTVRTVGGLPSIDLTTDDVDAMGDRVIQSGLTFRTPLPILFAHQYSELPVGQATASTISQGPHRTRVAWKWLENDPRAAAVKNAFDQGFLGASIGMKVLETVPNAHGGVDITRAEGIEGSLTATPANPACVRLLKDLGWAQQGRRRDTDSCPGIGKLGCVNTTSGDCPAEDRCPQFGPAMASWRSAPPILLLDDEPDDVYILVEDGTKPTPATRKGARRGDETVSFDPQDFLDAVDIVVDQETKKTFNKLRGRVD